MKPITEKTLTVYVVEIDGKLVEFAEVSRWNGLVEMVNKDHGKIIAHRRTEEGMTQAFSGFFPGYPTVLTITPIMASPELHAALGIKNK
jgi:hypothetical protein